MIDNQEPLIGTRSSALSTCANPGDLPLLVSAETTHFELVAEMRVRGCDRL